MKTFAYTVQEIEPPEWRYARDAISCTRIFKLAWDNHRDFIEKVLGTAVGEIDTIAPDKLGTAENLEAIEATVAEGHGT